MVKYKDQVFLNLRVFLDISHHIDVHDSLESRLIW